MTDEEYRDRLLLGILVENRKQARRVAEDEFVVVDVFSAAKEAKLPAGRRLSEAVKYYVNQQWIIANHKSDGNSDVVVTDNGRSQEQRIRAAWSADLSFVTE